MASPIKLSSALAGEYIGLPGFRRMSETQMPYAGCSIHMSGGYLILLALKSRDAVLSREKWSTHCQSAGAKVRFVGIWGYCHKEIEGITKMAPIRI